MKSLSDKADDCKIANIDKIFPLCAALVNMGDGIVYYEKDLKEWSVDYLGQISKKKSKATSTFSNFSVEVFLIYIWIYFEKI